MAYPQLPIPKPFQAFYIGTPQSTIHATDVDFFDPRLGRDVHIKSPISDNDDWFTLDADPGTSQAASLSTDASNSQDASQRKSATRESDRFACCCAEHCQICKTNAKRDSKDSSAVLALTSRESTRLFMKNCSWHHIVYLTLLATLALSLSLPPLISLRMPPSSQSPSVLLPEEVGVEGKGACAEADVEIMSIPEQHMELSTAEVSDKPELRKARDGKWYTWDAFFKHYGHSRARAMWNEAVTCLGHSSGLDANPQEEVRRASDGKWYTWNEFRQYYGYLSAWTKWNSAHRRPYWANFNSHTRSI